MFPTALSKILNVAERILDIVKKDKSLVLVINGFVFNESSIHLEKHRVAVKMIQGDELNNLTIEKLKKYFQSAIESFNPTSSVSEIYNMKLCIKYKDGDLCSRHNIWEGSWKTFIEDDQVIQNKKAKGNIEYLEVYSGDEVIYKSDKADLDNVMKWIHNDIQHGLHSFYSIRAKHQNAQELEEFGFGDAWDVQQYFRETEQANKVNPAGFFIQLKRQPFVTPSDLADNEVTFK